MSSDSEHHILWVNHYAIGPDRGGGTRHFELAREMIKLGWQVTIAAADYDLFSRVYTRRSSQGHREPVVERIEGVEFLWLWSAPYVRNDWRRGMNWLSFARSLLSWNKSGTPVSIVIGSSPHLFAALAAQRLALRLRVPFVLEIRDLWPESMVAAGGTKGGFYWLLHFVAEHLYRKASRIVVLARGTEDYLRKKGIEASKIVLVPNGVELEAYSGIERRARDTFTLIYTGAHGQANGLDVIVKAADILRDVPHVRFLLVGDGPMKPKLQEDVLGRGLGNVEFRSPVSKSRMPDLLLEADAGLMVLKETQLFSFGVSPNKLFDYLAAGLPVVCNVPGEVSQMLLASTAGEQAQDGTPESLAEAIRRLANRSHEERASMGRAGRQWVAREHNRNVLAAKLDAALRPMLDRN